LKNRGLLASLQKRQKHDLVIWEFQCIMMDCGPLFVDLSEDRSFVFDLDAPWPRTFSPDLVGKGQFSPRQKADG
jgi:hypothetical protein